MAHRRDGAHLMAGISCSAAGIMAASAAASAVAMFIDANSVSNTSNGNTGTVDKPTGTASGDNLLAIASSPSFAIFRKPIAAGPTGSVSSVPSTGVARGMLIGIKKS